MRLAETGAQGLANIGAESFSGSHHCRDDPGQLAGKGGCHKPRSTFSLRPTFQSRKPPLRFCTKGLKRCCSEKQQLPYISIARLGDASESRLLQLEICLGVSPRQAAKSRPELNTLGSGTLAAITEATSLPMPGISTSERLVSLRAWALAVSLYK
ncbi:hypothetical protein ACVWZL_000503 [Bradyrhizobium sp. GM2.4]